MRKIIFAFIAFVMVTTSTPSQAMLGADIPILLKILSNSISQLYQLMAIVQKTQDSLNLMRDINRGLNNTIGIVNTIRNRPGAGMYGDWASVTSALNNLQQIYGAVPKSSNSVIQRNADRSVAEAIDMNNKLFSYAKDLDQVGEQIQRHSQGVSPKGAAKLTAQSLGILVQVMNQSLRAQATGLKLQAQNIAMNNHREKEETRQFVGATSALSSSLKNHQTQFDTPRF